MADVVYPVTNGFKGIPQHLILYIASLLGSQLTAGEWAAGPVRCGCHTLVLRYYALEGIVVPCHARVLAWSR